MAVRSWCGCGDCDLCNLDKKYENDVEHAVSDPHK